MEPHAQVLGSVEALTHLAGAVAEGSDAAFLRTRYEHEGSCEAMVNAAIQRFRGERRLA
jgi:carboxylate-amine ligase